MNEDVYDLFVDDVRKRKAKSKAFSNSMSLFHVGDPLEKSGSIFAVAHEAGYLIGVKDGKFSGIYRYDEVKVKDTTPVLNFNGEPSLLKDAIPQEKIYPYNNIIDELISIHPDQIKKIINKIDLPYYGVSGFVIWLIYIIEDAYRIFPCKEVWSIVSKEIPMPVEQKWKC